MKEIERPPSDDAERSSTDFADEAARPRPGFFREFWLFLVQNRKWWLTPILVTLLLLGALVVVGGTAAAPFIYTLF